jgi:hypothetical protein
MNAMSFYHTLSGLSRGLLFVTSIGVSTLYGNTGANRGGAVSADGMTALVAQIDRNVEAGRRVIAAGRAQMASFDDETRAEFLQIEKAIQAAETRLRRSLKWTESASKENWSRARASLAANYETYAQAVDEAERLLAMEPPAIRRAPPPR